jgi:hypothetical protein
MGKAVPFLCHEQVRVGGHLAGEVRVMSGVQQVSVLGSLLFVAYFNDIWRITKSSVRLFADDYNL